MKSTARHRLTAWAYKQVNWADVRAYQRQYMRTYRKARPEVQAAANHKFYRKNKMAHLMYAVLVRLAKSDKVYSKPRYFQLRRRS